MDRTKWLDSLEKIQKGSKLSIKNTVKIEAGTDKSYGVVTGISLHRIYFTRYSQYLSSTGKVCCSKDCGQFVVRSTGATATTTLQPLQENELEDAIQLVANVLNQEEPVDYTVSLEKTIETMEMDKRLPAVWKHQTLAALYQILEEWEELKS